MNRNLNSMQWLRLFVSKTLRTIIWLGGTSDVWNRFASCLIGFLCFAANHLMLFDSLRTSYHPSSVNMYFACKYQKSLLIYVCFKLTKNNESIIDHDRVVSHDFNCFILLLSSVNIKRDHFINNYLSRENLKMFMGIKASKRCYIYIQNGWYTDTLSCTPVVPTGSLLGYCSVLS